MRKCGPVVLRFSTSTTTAASLPTGAIGLRTYRRLIGGWPEAVCAEGGEEFVAPPSLN
jgi:hypothetical protein